MLCSIFSVIVLLTLLCAVYSDDSFLNETIHIRVKRGKYFYYPSRFHRLPPMTYPTKGAFSYTPPPGYMHEEEPSPGRSEPRPKVSKKPIDGLRDEDITNIVKYLSKQDLDKLIDMASEKDRFRDNNIDRRPHKREERIKDNIEYSNQAFSFNGPYKNQDSEKFNSKGHWISEEPEPSPQSFRSQYSSFNGPYKSNEQFNSFKAQEQNDQGFRSQSQESYGPYRSQNSEQYSLKPQESTEQKYNGPYASEDLLNLVEDATQSKVIYINHDKNYPQPESLQNKQISFLNTYIHHEINDLSGPAAIESDKEEVLPKPVNLREDDIDISYTNNVPTVVKGPSYKVENFGDLPLMSNAHKLDTVSSYKVPHYTITSSKHSPPPPPPSSSSSYSSSSSLNVPLEPAPPVSAAKEQSDAHLKAIKIWTHRSQGTAYTLHNDGSLSLERPGKKKYGP